MIYTSKLISMPVINILESKLEGIVLNVLFSATEKKAKFLIVSDEDNDNIKKIINIKNIINIGSDALTIKNAGSISLYSDFESEILKYTPLINAKAYAINGNYIGQAFDVILNNNFNIYRIILSNKTTISSGLIFNFGDSTIITTRKKIDLTNFEISKEINVKNLSEIQVKALEEKIVPEKLVANINLLINRTTTKDIINSNGEILIRKNNKITFNILDKFRKLGKLTELSRYSK